SSFGITVDSPKVHIKKLLDRVQGIVKEGHDAILMGLSHSKLDVVRGKGYFIAKKTLQVGQHTYTAPKIFIATGAKNNIPPVEGLDKITYLTNENILSLQALPKSIILIGGGYISMEFATFFSFLGVKVTILESCKEILGMLDEDVIRFLVDEYEKKGIRIITSAAIHEVTFKHKKYTLAYSVSDGQQNNRKKNLVSDALFVATGRKPNTKNLRLEYTGVRIGSHGEIPTDQYMQTNVSGIYAMGDVTGRAMFAHAVKRESDIILHNLFHYQKKTMKFNLMPWAVFMDPVVAGIGLNEKQAQEKGIKYGILHARFHHVGRARVIGDQRGFVKILYNKQSHRIFGATIVGPQADIIIHEIIALMNSSNPSIDPLRKAIHIHPTLSEIMGDLR
ncbi:MAG: NAD(P)/FAD-dependent oxidoreductase, partial [Simkania sp.]|nr:NAD(P)/FAD-dependent oxidoreductase [Simkania sp.]